MDVDNLVESEAISFSPFEALLSLCPMIFCLFVLDAWRRVGCQNESISRWDDLDRSSDVVLLRARCMT